MFEVPVLVVGDCHGDLPVLQALLSQEGVLTRERECKVVQLGDLGHFGNGSQVRDRNIYEWAERYLDYVLWGNHDYAVFNPGHVFNGYEIPFSETKDAMRSLLRRGRMKLALECHGWLLTHAGLHASFQHNNVDPKLKIDVECFAAWMNRYEEEQDPPHDFKAIRDAISGRRGGGASAGGILWRDAGEKLYRGFKQVFGHSQKDKVRHWRGEAGTSYCIDVHSQFNGRLAGIWLPEERVVEVHLPGVATRRDKIR